MAILIKAFAYLVIFKGVSTLLFQEPLSVLATTLTVVAIVMIEFFAYWHATTSFAAAHARAHIRGEPYPVFGYSVAKMLVIVLLVSIPIALFIAYGFSEEFWRETFRGDYYRPMRHFTDENMLKFALMIAIPLTVNAGVFAWATAPTFRRAS